MSIEHVPPGPLEREPRAMLFTPGARLGWIFRDRRTLLAPYPEPKPDLEKLREQAAATAAAAQARYAKARRWAGKPSLIAAVVLVLLAGCAKAVNSGADTGRTLLTVLVLCAPGLAWTAVCRYRRDQAARAEPDQEYRQALDAWQQHATAHEQAQLAGLGQVDEWGSAEPPGLRTDVFGGNWWGWQALLTTHGISILAAQPLLVMDLSGQLVSGELTATARNVVGQVAQYVLPQDLDRCGLLARLSGPQFADALTEAIHAGTPGGARADRAIDVRILSQLIAALDGDISPVRLAAATQAALGHPVEPGLLTAQDEALIAGELFPPEYRQQIGPNLVRLDAFLTDLARYASHPATQPAAPAYYTCLAVDSSARSARGELLLALAVQWLTVQVSGSTASAPAVIIAGADELTRPHLERLADACERRQVPLTLMFRHLRDDALAVLGGGTAAFMRLGHHGEAEQAASYIGRQHTFVLSQLTATLGGNETHTRTDTEGYSVADSRTFGSTRGWTEDHRGGGSRTGGLTRSQGVTTSRNWSVAQSWATGTNWSEATSAQRVYEFAVEPSVLQHLPDHALLLTVAGRTGPGLQAVECDPAIVTLPGVSTRPLPPVRVPAQLSAARPAPHGLPGQQSPLGELTRTWSSRSPWEDHRPRHSRLPVPGPPGQQVRGRAAAGSYAVQHGEQQEQDAGEEDRAAGQHDPKDGEHRAGNQEQGPPARAHSACEPHHPAGASRCSQADVRGCVQEHPGPLLLWGATRFAGNVSVP